MSSLIRSSLLRSVASSSSSASRLLPILPASQLIRFNSTISSDQPTPSANPNPPKSGELFANPPSSSASSSLTQSTGNPSPKPSDPFSKLRFDNLTSDDRNTDPETWWKTLSAISRPPALSPSPPPGQYKYNSSWGFPTTVATGRSITVPRGGEFTSSYKRLQGLLRQSNLKKELRLQEFHEKPSVRRRRLISERHRRRFKEMVRTKVQQVVSMRNRA
ncbi:ribosomal protein S21 [Kwoniella dejecticola CBS 10117]|uniref:Ribosomal protein S21 n=1 Tax=Kwoniella dejecticola CBS 10117 TaxID=1296121 RepID=A0A1A6A1J4_9TREE|nr:ribosomal protein S21 [Kwoniella dejecticola CBS 10117]OBR83929.1 ribosomal protein S21 [Kwoniella dejecticola CBS 10117]